MSFEIINPTTHEEWLEARTGFVTATEVASAHTTRTAANWQQIKDRKHGKTVFVGNKYTQWGHDREPELAQWATVFCNPDLLLNEDPQAIVTRGDFSASPDAFTLDWQEGAEFKTTSMPFLDNPARRRYVCQVQFTMWITGAKRWWLIAEEHDNFTPMEPTSDLLEPDEKLQAALVATAKELHAFIFDGVEPDWMGGGGEDAGELEAMVLRLAQLETQRTEIDTRINELKGQVGELCGESASREFGDWKLTVSTRKASTRFNGSAFKKDHPDLHKQYMTSKVKGSKSVSVKRIEKEDAA